MDRRGGQKFDGRIPNKCWPGGHCDKILPSAGDTINGGQVIATMGSTGKASAPMLHFEIREGDTSLDPSVFIDK